MKEALASLGGFRRLVPGQPVDDRRGDLDGILHAALGIACVDGDAADRDLDAVGGEGFGLDRSGRASVHGVADIGAELCKVDLVDPAADLLVGGEQQPDRAVADIGVLDQDLRGGHDFGDARLVVGAEQRRAVGRDDIVADLVGELGIVGDPDDLCGVSGQVDVAALVVLDDPRSYALAAEIRRSVHMRAEADHRDLLVGVAGNCSVDVAVLVEMGIAETDGQQFLDEQAAEILLLFRGGLRWRRRVGLGVDGDIAQETFGCGAGHGSVRFGNVVAA